MNVDIYSIGGMEIKRHIFPTKSNKFGNPMKKRRPNPKVSIDFHFTFTLFD